MATISKEKILKAYHYRHACKEFDPQKKLSKEDIDFILEIARLSPSSFGMEPWHFIVVQDKDLRESLKPVAWGAPVKLDTASHFILGLTMKAPLTRPDTPHIKYMMEQVRQLPEDFKKQYEIFYRQFQERDFALDTDKKLYDWSAKQCYIALGNMMSAAAMIGIDSCPIEGFHQAKVEQLLSNKFEVDTSKYGISYMVAFGYRKANPIREKARRSIDEIVSWK